ncbi:HAMP domain-containing sensor histidine kinase [Mollicutes bacterium LVI A0039]|nr:HAMP domain-containing sensor histidine kinase [Mollicutes bacterium LVI A0039]
MYTSVDFNICIENDIQFPTKIENFYRIIDNLVNNALKHAKPNNISFSLKELEHSYLMCVTNDGAPISPNILEALFERHTSTSSTGIGLDIVSSIIEDLGYTINVNTTSDSTSFSVSIKK